VSEPDIAVRRTARAAARRLAAEIDPDIKTTVETALRDRAADGRPERYGADPVALGSLLVSAAALAWTIYRDLRGKTPEPTRRTVGQRVRLELPVTDPVPSAQRDRIIEVVVEEIVQDAEEDEPGSN
jgi:hypothetical protein